MGFEAWAGYGSDGGSVANRYHLMAYSMPINDD